LFLGEERQSDEAMMTQYGDTPAGLLRSMQDVSEGVDEQMEGAELSLFKGSAAVTSARADALYGNQHNDEDDDDEEEEEEEGDEAETEVIVMMMMC
jgi:ribosomal protein L12E/L44/L45/RPP1/RPP2